jgi:hypothetical protein
MAAVGTLFFRHSSPSKRFKITSINEGSLADSVAGEAFASSFDSFQRANSSPGHARERLAHGRREMGPTTAIKPSKVKGTPNFRVEPFSF